MDTSTVAILAVVGLVVLAGVVLLAAARRNQAEKAIGVLSRETRKRDAGINVGERTEGKASASGRELELAARLERSRSGKELVSAGSAAPTAWVPPDPDTLGATRRQFLN
ncbi:MAG TPA: hypothetical protein VFO65_08830, partial [Acidimicrobiales bacterium]|nr:hypothetical protein [Acidimicrobiales bacterium]